MATNTTNTDEQPTPPGPDMDRLGQIIAEGIAAGIAEARPKKVTMGQYDPKSSFHPNKYKVPGLKRKVFQNGYQCDPGTLHDDEIRLLNRITHSGRYLDRRVEIGLVDEGGGDQYITINYPNRTADMRMENKSLFRNFKDLLAQVVEAQEAEDADELERKTRPAAKK